MKESKQEYNIHRQQLFHWIGGDLEKQSKGRKALSDPLVDRCMQYVRGSLEKGLWVKSPRVPEEFSLDGQRFALTRPITCFTEWSLGESLGHTSRYGRIGFGFPKRWVIQCGGQSVSYFRHSEKVAFLRSAFRLLKAFATQAQRGVWIADPQSPAFDDLIYLLHFAKMIRESPAPRRPRIVSVRNWMRAGARQIPSVRKSLKRLQPPERFLHKFGKPLQYVEEREWRVVYHPANRAFVKGPGVPEHFLPYVPGEEMFTLVLPDNKVVSRILQNDWFTERLFTPWKHYSRLKNRGVPPVTVLSHAAIGTF